MLPSTKGNKTARNGFRRMSSKEVGRAEYMVEVGGKREGNAKRCSVMRKGSVRHGP